MKELSIEEKAKAYGKVREKIALRFGSNVAEEIFSEFEESEDERIRKALIKAIKMKAFPTSTCGGELFICGQPSDKCITWLEKQGQVKESLISQHENKICKESDDSLTSEDDKIKKGLIQYFKIFNLDTFAGLDPKKILAWLENQGKPVEINPTEFDLRLNRLLMQFESLTKEELASTLSFYLNVVKNGWPYKIEKKQGEKVDNANKVEAKFKVGDWVVSPNGVYWHIDAIRDDRYQVSSDSGGSADCPLDTNIYHKFTIQDAKDGDVLAYVTDEGDLWIMIYYSLYEPYEGHVHYHALLVNDNFSDKGTCCICIDNLKPATKEQRDTLMKAMTDDGYTFDFEKKELNEIEHKQFCELDNSYSHVTFPFKAKVKSTGTIVAIHGGQLSPDGKEWIKYQSDAEDGYKVYEPNNLELVCEIERMKK